MARHRHPKKDIELVLVEAEAHGWRIDPSGKKYWKAYCGCSQKHFHTIHLSPGAYYANHLRQWFRRQSCW
jgi:hypothetical protein